MSSASAHFVHLAIKYTCNSNMKAKYNLVTVSVTDANVISNKCVDVDGNEGVGAIKCDFHDQMISTSLFFTTDKHRTMWWFTFPCICINWYFRHLLWKWQYSSSPTYPGIISIFHSCDIELTLISTSSDIESMRANTHLLTLFAQRSESTIKKWIT